MRVMPTPTPTFWWPMMSLVIFCWISPHSWGPSNNLGGSTVSPFCEAFAPTTVLSHRIRRSAEEHASCAKIALHSSASSSSSAPSTSTTAATSTQKFNTTVCFPQSYAELMMVPFGDCIESETFSVNTQNNPEQQHQFRLKLYPRGGGHGAGASKKKQKSGFGMAYQQYYPSAPQDEKVGVYLQYLPCSPDQTVDATFALRMVGRQGFDVEWRAGMRFSAMTRLGQGLANDFGTHLMQTRVLSEFLGVVGDRDKEEKNILNMQVEIELHTQEQRRRETSESNNSNRSSFFLKDVRDDDSTSEDSPSSLRVGSVVVPVLRKLSQRPAMMAQGVYPGVEYRVLRMTTTKAEGNDNDKKDLFYYQPQADAVEYDLKPIYPLVPQLERPWPVTVLDTSIPQLVSPRSYNIVSAVGSLAAAASALGTAFLVSTLVSLFVIPSRSMEPTVQVGDVLLVEKITPRLFPKQKVDSIVLFTPPPALEAFVQERGGRPVGSRDLFVKRVIAAQPGDRVTVSSRTGTVRVQSSSEDTAKVSNNYRCQEPVNGVLQYLDPKNEEVTTVLEKGELMVVGDCGSVSIDSRVWGTLPESSIVGRPLLRVWPLSKLGPVE